MRARDGDGTGPRHARIRPLVAVLSCAAAASTLSGCTTANRPLAHRASLGQEAWVANYAFDSEPGSTVTPVDLVGHRADPRVTTASQPAGLAPTAGGTELLVANRGKDTLSLVTTATGKVTATATVGLVPSAVTVAPGGPDGMGVALVANFGANTVTPVDIATMRAGPPIGVGAEPDALAVAPAGPGGPATALVANFGSASVTPINLSTMTPGAPIAVGSQPDAVGIVTSALGPAAIVANFGSNSLTPINLSSLRPGTTIAIAVNPTGIAVAPGGATAWVVGGASITALSASTLTLAPPLALPDVAEAVALEGSSTAWVALQAGTLVPVTLPGGPVGTPVFVGGRPSAVVIPTP